MNHNIYLSLGSNFGDKKENILNSIKEIDRLKHTNVVLISSFYETKPIGYIHQPDFLNASLKIESELQPLELFYFLKGIEKKLGRIEREKWHEREIDIDIIYFNDLIYSDNRINIPHIESHNRTFVLEPLTEISPDFIHPILKLKNIVLLDNLLKISNKKT